MMLVLFEGPNGAGKTTLLKQFFLRLCEVRANARKVHIFQRIPRTAQFPDEYVTHAIYQTLRYIDLERTDVLVDRLWITDEIYNRVLLRDRYDHSYIHPAKDFHWLFVVYVTVEDVDVLFQRCPRTEFDLLFLSKLYDAYEDYFDEVHASTKVANRRWVPFAKVRTDIGLSSEQLVEGVLGHLIRYEGQLREGGRGER